MSQAHIATTDCDKEAWLGRNSLLELSKEGETWELRSTKIEDNCEKQGVRILPGSGDMWTT